MNATEPASRIFNGFYTIESPSGEHRTFRIWTQTADAKFAAGKRVVGLLTGPNNQSDYEGFAFVDDFGITVWRSKRGTEEPSFFERVAAVLWSMATEGEDSKWVGLGMSLLLDSRCLRCNRPLTAPLSIRTGIGPDCAMK